MDWILSKCRNYNDFEITNSVYSIKMRQFDALDWKVRIYKGRERIAEKKFMLEFTAMQAIKRLMINIEEVVAKEKEYKLERQMLSKKYVKESLSLVEENEQEKTSL